MNQANFNSCNVLRPYKRRLPKIVDKECPKSTVKAIVDRIIKARIGIERMDNPLLLINPLDMYLVFNRKLHVYRRSVGISTASIELLLFVYREFLLNGNAVTSYFIARTITSKPDPSSEALNIRYKLDIMVGKGLLVMMGQNDKQAYLYIPSVKAIDDIENIFK